MIARQPSLPSQAPARDATTSRAERLYDRNFALAVLGQTLFTLANMLVAHYNRWIEFLGGSVEQVGWIMGVGSVAGVALRPWMGPWINRLGARQTWLIGYGVFSIGAIGNLWLSELGWLIYVLRSCLVMGAAIVFASSLTYITQTTPPERRTEAIGILGAGGFVGMVLGPLLGDLIVGDPSRTIGDFHWLFLATAASVVLPAILLFFQRPSQTRAGSAVGLGEFLRIAAKFWPGTILWVCLAFGVAMTVPLVFLASYVDQLKLSIPGVSVVGLYFGCYGGWGLIVRVGLRRLPDQVGRRKVVMAGMLIMAGGMFCFPGVDASRPWLLVLPALLCGTGHALVFHAMTSLTLDSFPHEVHGTGSALSLMMLDSGTIAGAPVLGKIAVNFGFSWMYVAIGLACLASAAVYARSSMPVWRGGRRTTFQRRPERHEDQ